MKCGLNEKWLVCRICLQQPKEPMQTIFDRNIEKDLTRMILECGGVPIKQFDHYPDKICNKCYKCLQVAHKFRATCQRSHKHLSRFIAPVVVDKADNVFFEEDHDSFPEPSGMPEDPVSLEEPTEAVVKVENQQTDDDIIKEEFMLHVDDDEDEFVEIYEPMTEDEQKQVFEISDEHFTDDDEEEVEYLELEEDLELPSSDDDYVPNEVNSKQSRIRVAAKRSLTQQATTSQNVVKRVKREPKGKKSKGTSYICDFCGNKYPSQGRLTEHIKLHKGIKPHECEICGHAFAQTQQLARHMNTHTGNRPYKCSYCPAAFADLSTRNKHHRIHTNERPYVCDVCGKAFTYTNTLKFHKMIHTGEKPFVCEICGKGFQQAYKLRSHKMVHEKKGIKLEKAEAAEINSEQKYTPVQVEAVTQVLHM